MYLSTARFRSRSLLDFVFFLLILFQTNINSNNAQEIEISIDGDDSDLRNSKTVSLEAGYILLVSIALHGHAQPLLAIAEELSYRGHKVKFASYSEAKSWIPEKFPIEFHSLGSSLVSEDTVRHCIENIAQGKSILGGIQSLLEDVYLTLGENTYSGLAKLLEDSKPSLMVIDIGTFGGLEAAQKYEVPYIINCPTLLQSFAHESSNTNLIPTVGSAISINMSTWDRLMSIFFPRLISSVVQAAIADINSLRVKNGLFLYESIDDILGHTKILVNTAIGMALPVFKRPHVEYVGPLIPRSIRHYPEDRLDSQVNAEIFRWNVMMKDCAKWEKPVIFVNFGHMSTFIGSFLEDIEEGLEGFCILWTVPRDLLDMEFFARYFTTETSMLFFSREDLPYWDILESPQIELVVSHCGLASAQEALLHGKPLICLPFIGDQNEVAARIEDNGAGIQLLYRDTALSLNVASAAEKIISSKHIYVDSALRLAAFLCVKGHGITIAADIIESHLSADPIRLSQVQLYPGWDLIVFGFAILTLCLMAFRLLWMMLGLVKYWLMWENKKSFIGSNN